MARHKVLTEKKKKAYLANGGGTCPHCPSTSFDAGEFEMNGDEVSQTITCESCGNSWVDTYKLVSIEESEIE